DVPLRPAEVTALRKLYSAAFVSYYDNVMVTADEVKKSVSRELDPWVERLREQNAILVVPGGGGPGALGLHDLAQPENASPTARDPEKGRKLKLHSDAIVCLAEHGVGVWSNAEKRYVHTDRVALEFLPRFAGGANVGEVAASIGCTDE